MEQGADTYENCAMPVSAGKIDAILLTHAHLDSAHIQEQEAEWRNRKATRSGSEIYEPIYTVSDCEKALKQFVGYGYEESVEIFEGITIEFIDAWHLLGSASIHITINENNEERSIIFSGDLGNVDRPLIRNPAKPKQVDYVVIEATYGDRLHGERPGYIS